MTISISPQPDHVTEITTLPNNVDIVVIGGGIIGLSTALALYQSGVSVMVCEKGLVAGEQSGRNWGWVRQMGRDPREIPLILESMNLWRNMNATLSTETGYNECGIAYLAETQTELDAKHYWLEEHAKPYNLSSRIIGANEAAQLAPGSTANWEGALYTANDGRAEPQKAAPAMANYLINKGVTVRSHCAARGLDLQDGKIAGVVTEHGMVKCTGVVLAGGAWSRRFCHNIGIELPQLSVINSVMRTAPLDTPLATSASGGKFAYRKRLDGGYTIAHRHLSVADIVPDSFRIGYQFIPALQLDWNGFKIRLGERFIDETRLARRWQMDQLSPFELVRVLHPAPVDSILDEAASTLKKYFPVFADMQIAERWAGCIDATPDAVPIISSVEKIPGLVLATGFSGHGFGLGPGAGKLAAQLVSGATPYVDATPFRYSRFFDGSKPRPLAGL